ncbi:MAG TPA: helix-hairpin-helix domain-containing protein [Gaiellaceae bacterium]|nr:helix-hairpin-helix domain-containing protein [Gaiellaceae bacterium]
MPTISRRRALAYAAALLAVLALAGRHALGREAPVDPAPRAPVLTARPVAAPRVTVHVVGAVGAPGLYRLREGSRVDDAIRRAGGAKPKAALALVNLAAPVADGQQIVVPARGEAGPVPAGAAGTAGATGGLVHLNSATLEELDTLPGVGPVTAQKIIDYRTANGAFASVDELDAVPGIGPARLEQLRPLVGL